MDTQAMYFLKNQYMNTNVYYISHTTSLSTAQVPRVLMNQQGPIRAYTPDLPSVVWHHDGVSTSRGLQSGSVLFQHIL